MQKYRVLVRSAWIWLVPTSARVLVLDFWKRCVYPMGHCRSIVWTSHRTPKCAKCIINLLLTNLLTCNTYRLFSELCFTYSYYNRKVFCARNFSIWCALVCNMYVTKRQLYNVRIMEITLHTVNLSGSANNAPYPILNI